MGPRVPFVASYTSQCRFGGKIFQLSSKHDWPDFLIFQTGEVNYDSKQGSWAKNLGCMFQLLISSLISSNFLTANVIVMGDAESAIRSYAFEMYQSWHK